MFLVKAAQPVPQLSSNSQAGSSHRSYFVGHGEPSVIAGVIARAVLHHHESVSRGYDDDPLRLARLAAEVATMEERWGDSLYADPAYSPNLSLHGNGFSPAPEPRVVPPWRA